MAGTVGLGQVRLDGEAVYWIEQRPTEGGRNVIVRRLPDGTIADLTPAPFNARTRVHEYGGGAYAVPGRGALFFKFYGSAAISSDRATEPKPLTIADGLRYADAIVDTQRRRLVCVREDHRVTGQEAENSLVSIDLTSGEETILVSGSDFYSNPRLNPDGTPARLAVVEPSPYALGWDRVMVGTIRSDGSLTAVRLLAGGAAESIFQPEWSPLGILYFVSDRSGWWNLYRVRNGHIEALWKKTRTLPTAMDVWYGDLCLCLCQPDYLYLRGKRDLAYGQP